MYFECILNGNELVYTMLYIFENICRMTAKEKSRRLADTFSCAHTWRLLRNQSRRVFLKREISLMQGIWRLKEGFDTMREYGEKSYNPETLVLSCQGDSGADNEPMSCAKRKLPQNILLSAYQESLTIGQLCMELGMPAAYVEDEVENLVSNQLMKEISSGKYQTDFVILPWGKSEDNANTTHQIYNTCFPGYYDALMAFLEEHKELLTCGKFNTAGFSWDRLSLFASE